MAGKSGNRGDSVVVGTESRARSARPTPSHWGDYPATGFTYSGFVPEPRGDLSVCELGMKTNTPTPSSRAIFLAPAFALCGALAIFAGCSSEESHVVSAPPPSAATTVTTQTTQTTPVVGQTYVTTSNPGTTYTTTTTNPNPAVTTYVVTSAPPALQSEVVLARPSGDYMWVPGYWSWREGRYQWMSGHWELPPYRGSSWIAPHVEQEGNAYRFYEGHWN